MSERANIAAKRLGKKSASTLQDPKAAAAQAIVHLDDDLHKVGKDTQTAAARLQAQFRGHHARAMSRLLSWEMEKVTKLVAHRTSRRRRRRRRRKMRMNWCPTSV